MDFGIAKQHGPGAGGATVTATGALMGTPEYMSPEQLRGEEVDFRSDLYSLGVVVYELFTGALPFRGDTPVATIVRQLQDAPVLDLPALPEPLRPVLARALAKRPRRPLRRPPTRCGRALEAACEAQAPGRVPARARPARRASEDDTRPVRPGAVPESAADPADGGRAGGARGARRPPRERRRRPAAAPASRAAPLVAPAPVAHAGAHAVARSSRRRLVAGRGAARARPPAPRADARAHAAAGRRRPSCRAPTRRSARRARRGRPVDAARVYDEDEVDVKPRRIAGTTGRLPGVGARSSRKGQQRLDHRELRRHRGGPRHGHPRRAGRRRARGRAARDQPLEVRAGHEGRRAREGARALEAHLHRRLSRSSIVSLAGDHGRSPAHLDAHRAQPVDVGQGPRQGAREGLPGRERPRCRSGCGSRSSCRRRRGSTRGSSVLAASSSITTG